MYDYVVAGRAIQTAQTAFDALKNVRDLYEQLSSSVHDENSKLSRVCLSNVRIYYNEQYSKEYILQSIDTIDKKSSPLNRSTPSITHSSTPARIQPKENILQYMPMQDASLDMKTPTTDGLDLFQGK